MVSRVIIIRGFYLDLLLTFPLSFIKTLVNVNQSDKSFPDNCPITGFDRDHCFSSERTETTWCGQIRGSKLEH